MTIFRKAKFLKTLLLLRNLQLSWLSWSDSATAIVHRWCCLSASVRQASGPRGGISMSWSWRGFSQHTPHAEKYLALTSVVVTIYSTSSVCLRCFSGHSIYHSMLRHRHSFYVLMKATKSKEVDPKNEKPWIQTFVLGREHISIKHIH